MGRVRVLALVVVAAAITTSVALAARTPRQLRAAMVLAAFAHHSVHYVSMTTTAGHSIKIVSDVGRGRGIQRITVTKGSQSGPATVLIVPGSAYIKGNEFTLQNFFPFTQAQATRYAGQWISIPQSSGAYASVATDATYASFLSDLAPEKHLAVVHARVAGRKAVGLRGVVRQGNLTLVETVYAPASGKPLPFQEKATAKGVPGTSLVRISRWNEPVHVTAPPNSVPISEVVKH